MKDNHLDKALFIVPDWPLPPGIRSVITTRKYTGVVGPVNESDDASLREDKRNAEIDYSQNTLNADLGLDLPIQWLYQQHGIKVVEAAAEGLSVAGGASFSGVPGLACGILSADCLPVLICAKDGSQVAAAHAGWRGLAKGIIAATVATLKAEVGNLMAYLGPAICCRHYLVGTEVRQVFLTNFEDEIDRELILSCFDNSTTAVGHYRADLYKLARIQLGHLGVSEVYGGAYCTYEQQGLFYSYRRDHATARMASLIWIE